jgi:hypothetical protein
MSDNERTVPGSRSADLAIPLKCHGRVRVTGARKATLDAMRSDESPSKMGKGDPGVSQRGDRYLQEEGDASAVPNAFDPEGPSGARSTEDAEAGYANAVRLLERHLHRFGAHVSDPFSRDRVRPPRVIGDDDPVAGSGDEDQSREAEARSQAWEPAAGGSECPCHGCLQSQPSSCRMAHTTARGSSGRLGWQQPRRHVLMNARLDMAGT